LRLRREKATKEVYKTLQPKEQPKLEESQKYHAIVANDMTLAEVADTNGVALAYLKQQLGIPHYINSPYSILQLSRNYKFTLDDLRSMIDAYKDERTLQGQKTAAGEKENH
jgi:hypothetical protein